MTTRAFSADATKSAGVSKRPLRYSRTGAKGPAAAPGEPGTFTTSQAAALSGVTERMLQHWDELRMVVPNRVPAVGAGGVGRRYTEQHVRMAMVVGRLRKLPLSLANIKYMLRGVVLDKPLAVYMPGKRQGLLGTVRAIAEADVTRVLCASERGGLLIDLQH